MSLLIVGDRGQTDMAKIDIKLKPAREGDIILIVVPNYWGAGKDVESAVKQVKRAGGRISGSFRVYSSHPDAYIDDMGTAYSPRDHASILLQERIT